MDTPPRDITDVEIIVSLLSLEVFLNTLPPRRFKNNHHISLLQNKGGNFLSANIVSLCKMAAKSFRCIRFPFKGLYTLVIQYTLNGSNTDGSFTVDDSNSFFSPYKILPTAQENIYLGIFSYFIMYVVCTH